MLPACPRVLAHDRRGPQCPDQLTSDQQVLVHQVHPGKLAVDIGTSLLSDTLLWQHRLIAGLAVRYLGPALGSALVLRFANLDQLATSRAGQYVLKHMPASMMAVRFAGDSLMAAGAWKRDRRLITVGALLIALGWSHGLLALQAPDPRSSDRALTCPDFARGGGLFAAVYEHLTARVEGAKAQTVLLGAS